MTFEIMRVEPNGEFLYVEVRLLDDAGFDIGTKDFNFQGDITPEELQRQLQIAKDNMNAISAIDPKTLGMVGVVI